MDLTLRLETETICLIRIVMRMLETVAMDIKIPSEALSDEKFAKMIHEASILDILMYGVGFTKYKFRLFRICVLGN